jgi:hypothetical protein
LVRQLDVYVCGESSNGSGVLCMVEEIAVARLKLRIPLQDIKIWFGLARIRAR